MPKEIRAKEACSATALSSLRLQDALLRLSTLFEVTRATVQGKPALVPRAIAGPSQAGGIDQDSVPQSRPAHAHREHVPRPSTDPTVGQHTPLYCLYETISVPGQGRPPSGLARCDALNTQTPGTGDAVSGVGRACEMHCSTFPSLQWCRAPARAARVSASRVTATLAGPWP